MRSQNKSERMPTTLASLDTVQLQPTKIVSMATLTPMQKPIPSGLRAFSGGPMAVPKETSEPNAEDVSRQKSIFLFLNKMLDGRLRHAVHTWNSQTLSKEWEEVAETVRSVHEENDHLKKQHRQAVRSSRVSSRPSLAVSTRVLRGAFDSLMEDPQKKLRKFFGGAEGRYSLLSRQYFARWRIGLGEQFRKEQVFTTPIGTTVRSPVQAQLSSLHSLKGYQPLTKVATIPALSHCSRRDFAPAFFPSSQLEFRICSLLEKPTLPPAQSFRTELQSTLT